MTPSVHASCVCVGEAGVLIRGPSGAGKSSLAAALVETARAHGMFARLVADDRVVLTAANGRLIAAPPPALAGLLERRGLGVTPAPHLDAVVVRLAVDLDEDPPRMPDSPETVEIAGVVMPLVAVARRDRSASSLVMHALGAWIARAAL